MSPELKQPTLLCSNAPGYEGRTSPGSKMQGQVPYPEYTHNAREGDVAPSGYRTFSTLALSLYALNTPLVVWRIERGCSLAKNTSGIFTTGRSDSARGG